MIAAGPLMGVVPDPEPLREPEWSSLPKGRRARLTGAACGLTGSDLTVYVVMAENARVDGSRMLTGTPRLAVEAGLTAREVRRSRGRLAAGSWIRCERESKGGIVRPGKPNPTGMWRVYVQVRPVEIIAWGRDGASATGKHMQYVKALGAPTKAQRTRALNPRHGRRLWA